MRGRSAAAWLAAGLVALGFGAVAQVGDAGGGSAPAAEPAVVRVPLESLAFLGGTWVGTVGKDRVEETWSSPAGGSIVGMFRWMGAEGGRTTMYELLAITVEDGVPTLRLRHFNGGFEPWKGECEGVAALRATVIEPGRVVFSNAGETGGLAACEYASADGKSLRITVRFRDAARAALEFDLKRAGPGEAGAQGK
ncbi:MAG: hypothetical protein JNK35_00115 [Phycisphaerae bacterium]|nr:hypothetical protein [Phycisphaerae bacterium]